MTQKNEEKKEILVLNILQPDISIKKEGDIQTDGLPFFIREINSDDKGLNITLVNNIGQGAWTLRLMGKVLSFFGKKIIVLQEGGVVLTPDGSCNITGLYREKTSLSVQLINTNSKEKWTLQISQLPTEELADDIKEVLQENIEGLASETGDILIEVVSVIDGGVDSTITNFQSAWKKLDITKRLRKALDEFKKDTETQK